MTLPTDRHLTLDVIRGVAVMGILLANLPAFALPTAAYFSPLAAGGTSPADLAAWALNFVFVEGRMRGLFSLLFGASMLLVVDRARAAGDDPVGVHSSRMAVLFAIGIAHLYLIWWGDILAHYALCGMIALPFVRLSTRLLLLLGALLLLLSWSIDLAGLEWLRQNLSATTPEAASVRAGFAEVFGAPPAAEMAREVAAHRGGLLSGIAYRWQTATGPLEGLWVTGPQTVAAMLLGMAGLRSGFLTGGWDRAQYRRWAVTGLTVSLTGHAVLAWMTMRSGFAVEAVYRASLAWSLPLRVVGIAGYAALIALLMQPGGRWTDRIAAAGRTAFTNYLGTSILMTFVFDWGLGQFGGWSRAALYLLALPAWAIMLAWSAPWLRHHPYGPLEWLWRTVSRAERQPWRRQ